MVPRLEAQVGQRRSLRATVTLAAALLLALGANLAPPPARAAGSTTPTSTVSTFELIPDRGVVRVTVVFTITNRIPTVSTQCPPGYTDCTTSYYINEGSFAVDPMGVNFHASTPGGTARITVKSGGEGFLSDATVHFSNTFYGKTRVITAAYDIPGGAPRTGTFTRTGQAYASFCGFPAGKYVGDPESFRMVVPDRYDVVQTQGDRLTTSIAEGKNILSSPSVPRPESGDWHGACLEAVDEDAFISAAHTSGGGVAVETKAWPEDPDWLEAVSAIVASTLDKLEDRIGRSPETDAIEVREVSTEALGEYGGIFNSIDSVARVSEQALDPIVAVHELAHAWFNNDLSSETWLLEGYAESTARAVLGPAVIEPCAKPAADVLARVDVSPWHYLPALPTDADRQKVDDDYSTACWLLTEVSTHIGADALREVYAAAVDGEIAYVGGGEPETIRPGHVGWQTWMDLVDERGLVPAGVDDLEWLQELLQQVGATDDAGDLARRSDARAEYHAVLDEMGSWSMPIAIRMAMATWQWDSADEGLATAADVFRTHASSTELVGALRASEAVRIAFEKAQSPADLGATLRLADDEYDAAAIVARAQAAAEAGRNPIEWLGLLGDDLSADAQGAVASLVATELGSATRAAEATVKAGDDAQASGLIRLGFGGVVLGIGGGTTVVMRRRSRAAHAPAASTVAVPPASEPAATESNQPDQNTPPADDSQPAA